MKEESLTKVWICPIKQELGYAAWERNSVGDIFLGWVNEGCPNWLVKLMKEE